jgi:hypothetical protein
MILSDVSDKTDGAGLRDGKKLFVRYVIEKHTKTKINAKPGSIRECFLSEKAIMTISTVLILTLKGEVLINRVYRDDVPYVFTFMVCPCGSCV